MRKEGLEETSMSVIVLFEDYKMTKMGLAFNIFFFSRRISYAVLIIAGYQFAMNQAI